MSGRSLTKVRQPAEVRRRSLDGGGGDQPKGRLWLPCFLLDLELMRCRDCTRRFFGSFVAVRLRSFCRIGSYDVLIGSNNGSSLAVKIHIFVNNYRVHLLTLHIFRSGGFQE
ncbi:hypothetical protein IEQ34_009735 [Dendrobium chrysotoxum]|uniref:Uncharacterized protein n=1 Tax=Dendrobium chrysotoxum TaxID=161865 RepID=A0AAV7H1K8_DENCH|nr:hypothetical protein IEQ34_009735 [Dendrobium chrysotoxum]